MLRPPAVFNRPGEVGALRRQRRGQKVRRDRLRRFCGFNGEKKLDGE